MQATIYTTKACAYCPLVAKWLTSKGIEFDKVELDDNPQLREKLREETGAMTVPITKLHKSGHRAVYVVGWKPTELAKAIS